MQTNETSRDISSLRTGTIVMRQTHTIAITGGAGSFDYRFPQGEPVAQAYPLDDQRVAKVDFIEYLAFYGEIDIDGLPDSIDILDIGFWTDTGRRETAEADFRAEHLFERLWASGDRADRYDRTEVDPVCIVGLTEQQGLCLERDTGGNPADAVLWTVYGHLKEGGAQAWYDFRDEQTARTIAALLEYRLRTCRAADVLAQIGVAHA